MLEEQKEEQLFSNANSNNVGTTTMNSSLSPPPSLSLGLPVLISSSNDEKNCYDILSKC